MLDRARKLDPLEPGHDVTKALFLLYGARRPGGCERAAARGGEAQPAVPAGARAPLRREHADRAGGEKYSLWRAALALDPSLEMTRRNLISAYVDLGDMAAAAATASRTRGSKRRRDNWRCSCGRAPGDRQAKSRTTRWRPKHVSSHDRDRHERRRDSHACASHGRVRAGAGRARGRLWCALGHGRARRSCRRRDRRFATLRSDWRMYCWPAGRRSAAAVCSTRSWAA